MNLRNRIVPFCLGLAMLVGMPMAHAGSDARDVKNALDKASAFMMEMVAERGGFVWQYSNDLTQRWGEVPARPTQIWVQGATNGVGELMLDCYDATGDSRYLDYAKRVADAIVAGQHPSGGWHYLIDFDMPGIQQWYDEVASQCWGWEEYYHFYGNCTFDDDVISSSVSFLMRLYMTTLDPAYREPLRKGLGFMLEAQYPNGAWPQRYPLSHEFVKDGKEDYTSFYTLNDNILYNNVHVLLDAWDCLGDEVYRDAALRAMDFMIAAQFGRPQAGWSDQYKPDMTPGHARSYEPAGISTFRTKLTIGHLEEFYKITGDRRYLNPIPAAIDWLRNSVIDLGPNSPYTHALNYEFGSNRPLYVHREGTSKADGRYYTDYTFGNPVCHLVQVMTVDIDALEREFERVAALTPEEAHDEYLRGKSTAQETPQVSGTGIRELIDSLDSRGAWVTELRIPHYADPCGDFESNEATEDLAADSLEGINVHVFLKNMELLLAGYSTLKTGQ